MGEQLAGAHRPVRACLGGGFASLAVGLGYVGPQTWANKVGLGPELGLGLMPNYKIK